MFRLNVLRSISNYTVQYKKVFQIQCQCLSSVKIKQKYRKSNITSHLQHVDQQINAETPAATEISEQEYLVRLKNNPDVFGTAPDPEILDEGDMREEKFFTEQPSPSRKLRTKQYADMIKEFIKKRKIKEAIDVLEIRMIQEDRVKPENYIYNLILGACGRVGYTKKAFALYNDMKKRRLKITGGTYTALFNACANSPWPEDGLTRANHLRNIMIEKQDQPNDQNYNAMIKAFGRCGDLSMAFCIADEMESKGFTIKDDTINFLLQSCISDKEAGFRHALLVWRKVVDKNIAPSIYTYNLMLRCIRDCSLGDVETTQDVIGKLLEQNQANPTLSDDKSVKYLETTDSTSIDDGSDNSKSDENRNIPVVKNTAVLNPEICTARPNLMAATPHLGNVISLSEVTKPEDRLLLVGGCSGFLKNMEEHGCKPDIKTFTQLLLTIPSTLASELDLLNAMKKLRIKPDLDFYNMLIKKRSMRFDYEKAKEVLQLIDKANLEPDLITYGVLSLGCQTREEALELLHEMKEANYRMNAEILGAMLHQACHHYNFGYVLEMMEFCLKENVEPNKIFMAHLEEFKKHCRAKLNSKEASNVFEKAFMVFKLRYKTWLTQVKVDEAEDSHPWQQYRQTTEGDVKYKAKDTGRFKPRHLSKFKVKTSPKHVATKSNFL